MARALIFTRGTACVLGAMAMSFGQGIHADMKPWEWWKFAALATGAGALALGAFLDTSFGRLWHKDAAGAVPPVR